MYRSITKFQLILSVLLMALAGKGWCQSARTNYDQRIDSLLAVMTIEEKIGQLNQYTGDRAATGPVSPNTTKYQDIRNGRVGSLLNVRGATDTRMVQELALQSRLHIPLLFGMDVIHGYRTTFPVPLAEASSWDMDAIEKSARIAAIEASAAGIHWTFAPMVDIARDPRWGRVTEGAGEDPFLGSAIATARVKGFQGSGLGALDAVMACVKHFAGYGAALAGRDYTAVDMSLQQLWQVYLPPFKAALDAGAASFMNAFNLLNGIPSTANDYLLRNILKGQWNFQGLVVSDWNSVGEMVSHGFARDKSEAAKLAIAAGCDMYMESHSYIDNLEQLVGSGKVSINVIDDAVRRVLRKKFELGLFSDPFRFSDPEREKNFTYTAAHRDAARDMARKSIVLLKNEQGLLPVKNSVKSIALIGPLARSGMDMKGAWSVQWSNDSLVSIYDGLKEKLQGRTAINYAKGCGIDDSLTTGFAEAVAQAAKSDLVIVVAGESREMSGEAKSRAHIHLPGVQEELIKTLQNTGKPIVVIVLSGRPLILRWTADHVPAILWSGFSGSEGGRAWADVLLGDYNPSGKLPITFPRSEGQIPIFYSSTRTGRPVTDIKNITYRSAYIDELNTPEFAFGHGRSYTSFEYAQLTMSAATMKSTDSVRVSFVLKNTGNFDGTEIVQLYLHDKVARIARPVKELIGFRKVELKKGERRTVSFNISVSSLSYYDSELTWSADPGSFHLMIGSASDDIRLETDLELID